MVDHLIVIKAQIYGRTGNFVLDTGSKYLALNKKYFQGQPTKEVYSGIEKMSGKVEQRFVKLEIGPLKWKGINARVIPMDHIEDVKSIDIHGFLGNELFNKFAIFIDYPKREVRFYPLDRKGDNPAIPNLTRPDVALPFLWKGGAPVIEASLGSLPLRFMVDTGAEINLVDKNYRMEMERYLKSGNVKQLITFKKTPKTSISLYLTNLQVGNYFCTPMKTIFTSLYNWNSALPGRNIDGILSYEFLSQFQVMLNFKRKRLYLWETPQKTTEFMVTNQEKK